MYALFSCWPYTGISVAVHIQHDPLLGIDGFRLGDQFAVDAGQATEVLLLGQHLGLKGLQAGGQRRATIPSLLRTDQPERRILREPLGVVDILIARDAAVDGLAEQIGERKLGVLPAPRITQVLGDQFAEAQPFIQLAHQNEAPVGGDARSLEIDLQRSVKRELKWLDFVSHPLGVVLRSVFITFKPLWILMMKPIRRFASQGQNGNVGSKYLRCLSSYRI